MAPFVHSVTALEYDGINPHAPVRLLLRGDARRLAVKKLVRPGRVAAVLQHGPTQNPELLPPLLDEDSTHADAEAALQAWHSRADAEFAQLGANRPAGDTNLRALSGRALLAHSLIHPLEPTKCRWYGAPSAGKVPPLPSIYQPTSTTSRHWHYAAPATRRLPPSGPAPGLNSKNMRSYSGAGLILLKRLALRDALSGSAD